MDTANTKSKRVQQFYLFLLLLIISIVLLLALVIWVECFLRALALLGVVIPEMGGVEAAIKLLEICPGTKIVLVTESVPPETVKRLVAQGYHFQMLPAPFTREELHAVVFGDSQGKSSDVG